MDNLNLIRVNCCTSIVLLLLGCYALGQADFKVMTASEWFQSARQSMAAEDYEGAATLWEGFLEEFGESEEIAAVVAEARCLMAWCEIRRRRLLEAEPWMTTALADPHTTPKWVEEFAFWQALSRLHAENYSEAHASLVAFYDAYHSSERSRPRIEEAIVLQGICLLRLAEYQQATDFLDDFARRLKGSAPETAARLVVLHLHTLIQLNRWNEALELFRSECKDRSRFDQVISLQTLSLELGAQFLNENQYTVAIECFHHVWPLERIIAYQRKRLDGLTDQINGLTERRNDEGLLFQLERRRQQIEREIEKLSDIPNYDAALYLRMAHAMMGRERFREAALILEAAESLAPSEEISTSLVHCWLKIEYWSKAVEAADRYLDALGNSDTLSAPAERIAYLKGHALRNLRKYSPARKSYGRVRHSDLASQADLMRGICLLYEENYTPALRILQSLQQSTDSEVIKENAHYWEAMAHSFAGDHAQSLARSLAYMKDYPSGRYAHEMKFREAYCYHAQAHYERAIERFTRLIRQDKSGVHVNEARLLLGDAFLAQGKFDEGRISYVSIDIKETRFYEAGYFKVGEWLRQAGRIEEMKAHFHRFITDHPESLRLAEALYWQGWCLRRDGNSERARELYWDTLRQYGDDPRHHTSEQVVLGLISLYPSDNEQEELLNEWSLLETKAANSGQVTLRLRAVWGRAKTHQVNHRVHQATAILTQLVEGLLVKIHSPRMIADCGDALREIGDWEHAEEMYKSLSQWHPNTLERVRAEAGLALIAMRRGKYAEAVDGFRRATRRQMGIPLASELQLAELTCLEKLGRWVSAEDLIRTLLADPLTSLQTKAEALTRRGNALAQQGKLLEALVCYERVYLVYNQFRPWVAKAYLERGLTLEKLKMPTKAVEVYQEFLARPELSEFAEYESAKSRLASLNGTLKIDPQ